MSASSTFTMKHNDRVVITLPKDTEVTVSENNEGYKSTFKLDSGAAEAVTSKTFTVSAPTALLVTNTKDGFIPTGISSTAAAAAVTILFPAASIGLILYHRRRRRRKAGL